MNTTKFGLDQDVNIIDTKQHKRHIVYAGTSVMQSTLTEREAEKYNNKVNYNNSTIQQKHKKTVKQMEKSKSYLQISLFRLLNSVFMYMFG